MSLAPICLFTYNRLEETQQTVKALKNNFLAKESELFVFSDGWKNDDAKIKVNNVRVFLKTINGFKKVTVFESDKNKGLANSIISGVSQIISEYGKVIVLEDDLITTPNFLDFMNQALEFYKNRNKIYSINGFSLLIDNFIENDAIYYHKRACSWGWASWSDRWNSEMFNKNTIIEIINKDENILNKFKNEMGDDTLRMLKNNLVGNNNSWYIRWIFQNFLNNKISIYPSFSKVINIGFNPKATHCDGISVYKSKIDLTENVVFDFKNEDEIENVGSKFLFYFSMKYKIFFRLKMLKSKKGLLLLIDELRNKIK